MQTRSAEDIFHEARELPTGERADFLRGACGDDATLLNEVESLLGADIDAGSFMEMATVESAAGNGAAHVQPREQPGESIGRYKLLQVIGEGGFGEVWMAEQREPVKRRVALKIIKLGMDTKQVIARFEAERQALAMMDHPNIAKVLDAGATEAGRPYFVMEYIRGVPILEYCDSEKLDTRARLDLFTTVCQAIQHAHQKGIIHRDIKPTNVLITLHDGVPVPKVIDFGIAKATNQELTEKTLFTRHHQMIGTPAYMSPEQSEMSGLDIDTRSDIYSLGVLLYELLTGTTPVSNEDLMNNGYEQMMRLIREVEPQKPSTRLSDLGQTALHTAEQRCAATPQQLGLLLKGDLDWIVMKCLEKDRARRYETATGLAADIQRHLRDEPVQAGRPNASYKLRKLVKRNKGVFAAAAVVLLALVLGVIGTTAGLVSALRAQSNEAEQRRIAELRFEAAQRFVETVSDDVLPQVSNLIGATGATSALTGASSDFLESLAVDAGDAPDLRWLTVRVMNRLAIIQGSAYSSNSLGDFERSLATARRALALLDTLEPDYPTPAAHFGMNWGLRDKIASSQSMTGDLAGALATYLDTEQYANDLVQSRPEMFEESPTYPGLAVKDDGLELGLISLRIGHVYRQMGDYETAFDRYSSVCIPFLESAQDPRTADEETVHSMTVTAGIMASSLAELGRFDEALPYARRDLEVTEIKVARWPNNARFARDLSTSYSETARILIALGEYAEAEELIEKGVAQAIRVLESDPLNGSAHMWVLRTLNESGRAALDAARSGSQDAEHARRLATRAIEIFTDCQQRLADAPDVNHSRGFFDLSGTTLDESILEARQFLLELEEQAARNAREQPGSTS